MDLEYIIALIQVGDFHMELVLVGVIIDMDTGDLEDIDMDIEEDTTTVTEEVIIEDTHEDTHEELRLDILQVKEVIVTMCTQIEGIA